ncbi:MAG: Zinc transporter ZupT [Syntrophorhabdus sp. PtaB.Bin047]|jgi:ZIP family zinc transporter|nr:MAG: Zinc transporter ZupT [Syntrophorhabdus sp. PtaB.Bin047]
MTEVWTALGLTTFAGLATGIGSVIAFAARRTNYRFLSVSTGFSAGVMLYVSFVEIFFKGSGVLVECYGDPAGHWINVASFFGGVLFIGVIDQLIPSSENPHETHAEFEFVPLHGSAGSPPIGAPAVEGPGPGQSTDLHKGRLMRMGLFTALAITVHNLPEGLATFLAALKDPGLGLAIATAIALHNIPEGISVSVPIFYATGKRRKAFFYSFLSGMAEPVAAAAAYLALRVFTGGASGAIPEQFMGILFGGVAGVMVYISLDELLPASRAYGKGHDSLFGLISGMAIMALSLLLMKG